MAKFTLDTLGPTSISKIHESYEERAEDWRRDHLGASIIGHRCDRYLWLSFRWAANPNHDGKQLRLFKRGKVEERWIIDDLRNAGFTVVERDPETKRQLRVRWGHVGGSLDGVITGLLEAPTREHVLEVKTHSLKSFEWLKSNGVKRAKPEHYTQMQVYMLGRSIDRAFYVAVCKDNDELYGERVALDSEFAKAALERAQQIVSAEAPPLKLDKENPPCMLTSKEGKQWPCQFYDLCHGERVPERNCRTCAHSTPKLTDGMPTFHCALKNKDRGRRLQIAGCDQHRTIPPIINAQVGAGFQGAMHYTFASGKTHIEGGGK